MFHSGELDIFRLDGSQTMGKQGSTAGRLEGLALKSLLESQSQTLAVSTTYP